MIDRTLLLGAGVSTSKNELLKKIWRQVDIYNMFCGSRIMKGRQAAELLDKIMVSIITYLTSKPPQNKDKNKRRWAALADLGEAVLKEMSGLGFKALGTPTDLKNITDCLEDMCFYLERLDPEHRCGQALTDAYKEWRDDLSLKDGKPSFWTHLGSAPAMKRVQMFDEDTRSQFQLHYDDGVWKDRDDKPANTQDFGRTSFDGRGFAIFVASMKGELYYHEDLDHVHHSSFLAGAPVMAAGGMMIIDGRIRLITPHSGHYQTTPANMKRLADKIRQINGDGGIRPDWDVKDYYRISEFRLKGTAAKPLSKEEIAQLKSR
jgi:hypothetical protein